MVDEELLCALSIRLAVQGLVQTDIENSALNAYIWAKLLDLSTMDEHKWVTKNSQDIRKALQ